MGVRDLVPGLMLRLDMDQECYDFIKWWRSEGPNTDDVEPIFYVDEDALEQPTFLRDEWAPLSFAVQLTLLKIKLLIDLQNVATAVSLCKTNVPCENVVRSGVLRQRKELYESGDFSPLLALLKQQIKQLYGIVQANNKFFWDELLQERTTRPIPSTYSRGTQQEAELIWHYSSAAFAETTGAIDVIKALKIKSF